MQPIKRLVTLAMGMALTLGGATALADVTAAGKAFSEGQAAQLEGDYAAAAEKFELAHSIMPSAAALRSAARMRHEAGNLALAATHAATLERDFPDDEESVELSRELLKELRPQLVLLRVDCVEPCSVSSDGRAIGVDKAEHHTFFSKPGQMLIQAWFGGGAKDGQKVNASAGDELALEFAPPADEDATDATVDPSPAQAPGGSDGSELANYSPTPPPPVRTSNGVHPAWFYVSLSLTVAGGASTTWFGMQTLDRREEFDRNPTQSNFDRGKKAQLFANVSAGATAAFGVTAIILALVTDWEDPSSESHIALTPNGLAGTF